MPDQLSSVIVTDMNVFLSTTRVCLLIDLVVSDRHSFFDEHPHHERRASSADEVSERRMIRFSFPRYFLEYVTFHVFPHV